MFIRFSALLPIAALAAVAAAAPSVLEARQTTQCNTGSIQCCNNTYSETSATISELTGLLGIVLPSVTGLVGLGCTPITVVGTGTGADCLQQPVCCSGNTYSGLINLGCSPLNLNL